MPNNGLGALGCDTFYGGSPVDKVSRELCDVGLVRFGNEVDPNIAALTDRDVEDLERAWFAVVWWGGWRAEAQHKLGNLLSGCCPVKKNHIVHAAKELGDQVCAITNPECPIGVANLCCDLALAVQFAIEIVANGSLFKRDGDVLPNTRFGSLLGDEIGQSALAVS